MKKDDYYKLKKLLYATEETPWPNCPIVLLGEAQKWDAYLQLGFHCANVLRSAIADIKVEIDSTIES